MHTAVTFPRYHMTVKKKAGETDITHGGKDEIMNGSNGKNISVKAAAVICAVCIAAASAVTWGIAAKTGSDPGSPIDKIDISDGTDSAGETIKSDGSVKTPEETGNAAALTASEIYAQNIASTVGITAKGTTKNIFGQTTSTASSGTGFVIRSDGYILTNHHVINGADEFTVTFSDGTSYPAEVVGYESDVSDIAVLKIDKTGLRPVTFGKSSEMAVGEDITVIGNPLGELTFSLTRGVVSALDRKINTDGNPITMFQIDAAVNSGNSGGPAFDSGGNVVGIVTAKYASGTTEGLGFCIPSDSAEKIASDIIEYGYMRGKTTLGISYEDAETVYEYYYRRYGMNVNRIEGLLTSGVYVASVTSESPAEKAGLEKGDYITAADGAEISGSAALKAFLGSHNPGDTVTLTICRSGKYSEITVTLGEYVPEASGSGTAF